MNDALNGLGTNLLHRLHSINCSCMLQGKGYSYLNKVYIQSKIVTSTVFTSNSSVQVIFK